MILPRLQEVLRPVMGHTRSRFFAYLPANTPVQSHQISPKSLFRNILTLLSSLARKFPCMLMKTRNFESGGGYPPPCLLSKWGTVHSLAATARAAARHTSVAAAVAGHDGSADRAAW